MSENIMSNLADSLMKLLPDTFMVALNSYEEVITHKLDEEPKKSHFKKVSEREDAARKCLAHIQLLLKLCMLLGLPQSSSANHDQIILAALIKEAEDEVQGYDREQDE